MIINNKSSVNNLVFILNFNCIIYIISQTFNNGTYIFNILPINITDNNVYYIDNCIDDYKLIDIYSSIILCISFIYFIYKCQYLRINFTDILQFLAILLLNVGFNLFNIIYYYYILYNSLVEKDCNINYISLYMYFNLLNISFIGCNLLVYIYNLKLINQLDN
jgi:hypothetical protein